MASHSEYTDSSPTCTATWAGYDGMFGIYCSLPQGHAGPHEDDGMVRWEFISESDTMREDAAVVRPVPPGSPDPVEAPGVVAVSEWRGLKIYGDPQLPPERWYLLPDEIQ